MSQNIHIYLIAGEESGDFIGGGLITALRHKLNERITISGIGGLQMQEAGLTSFFPMQELSLMGFAEIIPHIFALKRRIRETVADIIAKRPDVIVTIDSPGFNYRVVKRLRELQPNLCPIIHYVAPTVWAYKPERAQKTAALFDALLTILPFEPPYFTGHGLNTQFVGHPAAWFWKERGDAQNFRTKHAIPYDSLAIGVMPGSRKGELRHHLPVFKETFEMLTLAYPKAHIIMPVRPSTAPLVEQMTKDWPLPVHIIIGNDEKKAAFAACNVALSKSGTVALEASLAGIPTVMAYKANPITIWLVRRMVKISHANLINIMAKQEVIPEFLQEHCTAIDLSSALHGLISDENKRKAQLEAAGEVLRDLGQYDSASPSEKAAEAILQILANQPLRSVS